MKFYNLLIKYRLWIGLVLIALGVYVNYSASFWPAFPLYLVGVILIAGHFFFGPLRLIQQYMEDGDMDGAEKVLNSIKFPQLLYKPIRSVYYTLQGNISMMKQDFVGAEKSMKKGLDLGMPMKEAEGASMLQMGMLMMQKKRSEAEVVLKELLLEDPNAARARQMLGDILNFRKYHIDSSKYHVVSLSTNTSVSEFAPAYYTFPI